MISSLNHAAGRLKGSPALQYILLAAVLLLATAMRFYKLGSWSFWIDEIYEIQNALRSLENLSPTTRISLPLTGLLLETLGVSEWTARLLAAIFGILTLAILYFPVRRLFGPWVALLAMFLLAISPWHLGWSQNARFYTPLLLFYTLSLYFFFIGLEKDRPILLLFSVIFLGMATLERMLALFFIPVVLIYLAVILLLPFERPAGLKPRNLTPLAVPAIMIGVYEVYLVAFAGQQAFFADFVNIFLGRQHNPIRVLLSVVSDMGLAVFVFGLAGAVYLLRRRSRLGVFISLNALIPLAILVLMAPFTQAFSRYVFHTLVFWIILAAFAVVELFSHLKGSAPVLALGVIALVSADAFSQDVLYYQYQNGNRQDWKGAFRIVEGSLKPGDQVVTTRQELGEYYLDREVTWTQGLDPQDVEASGQRTWFVIDDRTGFISPELDSWLLEKTDLIGVRDVYIPGKLMAMRVYLYRPQAP